MRASFTALAGWHDAFHEILNHLKPPIDDYDYEYDYDGGKERESYFAAIASCRKTWLSLALSSHALSNPSLDKLWSFLPCVTPLFRLLPNFQRCDGTYRLIGEISPEAWSRLQTYASRVCRVSISQEPSIHPLVWTAISEQCKNSPLFPNLGALHMIIRDADDAICSIRILVTPSLRSVSLSSYYRPGEHQTSTAVVLAPRLMLQEIFVKSPGLEQFFASEDLKLDRKQLMALSRFTHIQVLDVNDHSPFDDDLLPMLANFRSLTHLEVSILLRDPAAPLDLGDGFQKLTRLILRGSLAHLVRFILASSMPRLNYLYLGVGSHVSEGFDTSLAAICGHIGPHTVLTHFRADLGELRRPPRFLMAFLEPLLPFANLEDVEINFWKHIPVRDEDLQRFAGAWPKLRRLILMQSPAIITLNHFNRNRIPSSVERPTLRGLVELARGCPQLDRLCIPDLDATVLPQPDSLTLMGQGPFRLCIQHLVGALDEKKQLDVAIILDHLFPRLKLKSGIEEVPDDSIVRSVYPGDLMNVSRLLRAMQDARVQALPG